MGKGLVDCVVSDKERLLADRRLFSLFVPELIISTLRHEK